MIGGTITRGGFYQCPTNNLKLYFLKNLISETYHSFGPFNWSPERSVFSGFSRLSRIRNGGDACCFR